MNDGHWIMPDAEAESRTRALFKVINGRDGNMEACGITHKGLRTFLTNNKYFIIIFYLRVDEKPAGVYRFHFIPSPQSSYKFRIIVVGEDKTKIHQLQAIKGNL